MKNLIQPIEINILIKPIEMKQSTLQQKPPEPPETPESP